MKNKKLFVLGLDGATWELIEKWRNKLPNLNKLLNEGTSGILKSCVPASTFPAWKCYSTGKNPDQLDVYGFFRFNRQEFINESVNSTFFKSAEIWDYLGERDKKSAVINLPVTNPPRKINGFMISGPFIDRNNSSSTVYPNSLNRYLKKINYQHILEPYLIHKCPRDALKIAKKFIVDRFNLAEMFLDKEKVDFVHLTIFLTDEFQHIHWDNEIVFQLWKFIDSQLPRIIRDDLNLFIMSDHGFQKTKTNIRLNKFLQDRGYLKLNYNHVSKYNFKSYFSEFIRKVIYKIKLRKLVMKLPAKILIKLRDTFFKEVSNLDANLKLINFDETKAFFMERSGEGIYLLDKNCKDGLIKLLKNFRTPDGKFVFKEIKEGIEIYPRGNSNFFPDLILITEGYRLLSSIEGPTFDDSSTWLADHRPEGIFIAYGRDIKKNSSPIKASIVDIFPTILNLFRMPLPDDIDGKILDVFKDEQKTVRVDFRHPIVFDRKQKKHESEEIIQRLKSLGYME